MPGGSSLVGSASLEVPETSVSYTPPQSIDSGKYKHRLIQLAIKNIKHEDPEVPLSLKQMGLHREVVWVNPQPVGEPFSVIWNGDSISPTLRFDGWPGEEVRVVLDVWGR